MGDGDRQSADVSVDGDTQSKSLDDQAFDSLFGFLGASDEWMERARRATAPPPPLGRLGAYELIEQVGRGGQGVVFRAVQPGTGRTVALKCLGTSHPLGGRQNAAFAREVSALTRLDHPNVVRVHTAEIIDAHPVLIMEWVEGITIDRWADQVLNSPAQLREVRRESLRLVLRTFVGVCDGVAHAHQRGVIHRDLKPGNIVVSPQGVARVLDFGIARLFDGDERVGPSVSQTLGFMGTPQYAAPEQLEGHIEDIDTRTDVFALGAIAFRILTGTDRVDRGASLAHLLHAARRVSPPRPSSRCAGLGKEMDWIVLRALAPEPDRRYPSAEALASDIRRFLEGGPVEAHPPTIGYLARKSFRRHRGVWIAASAVGAALSGAVLGMSALYARAEVARKEAELALGRERAQEAEARAQAAIARRESTTQSELTRFMIELLMNADRGAQGGRADITIKEAVLRAAGRLDDGSTKLEPLAEATVRRTVGDLFMSFGDVASALPYFERSLALRKQELGPEHGDVADTLLAAGRAYRATGRLDLAEQAQVEAIRVQRVLHGHSHPLVAEALTGLGITYRFMNRLDDSAHTTREAINMYAATLGPHDENVFMMSGNLAALYASAGRAQEALALAEWVMPQYERRFTDQDQEIFGALVPYSMALRVSGHLEDAIPVVQRATRVNTALSGEEHAGVRDRKRDLAEVLLMLGRDIEAEPVALEVYAATLRLEGPNHRNAHAAAAVLARAGAVRTGEAQWPSAERVIRSACGSLLAAGEFDLGHVVRLHLARVLAEQGRLAEADQELTDASAALRTRCPSPFVLIGAQQWSVQCYDRMAQIDPAGRWAAEAAAIRQQRTQFTGAWKGVEGRVDSWGSGPG